MPEPKVWEYRAVWGHLQAGPYTTAQAALQAIDEERERDWTEMPPKGSPILQRRPHHPWTTIPIEGENQ